MKSKSRYLNDLTAERVRELFHYDPETGRITWRMDRATNAKAGDRAGCINRSDGYMVININGTNYSAHRLIWLWMTGEWPHEEIDHVNRIRHDNRFCNLREASPSENSFNSPTRGGKCETLPRGVHKTRNGKFQAKIGRNIHIGTYDTVEEAGNAYALAATALYGEFYRGTPAIAPATTVETTPRLWRRI
jgi:HNH endonuclease